MECRAQVEFNFISQKLKTAYIYLKLCWLLKRLQPAPILGWLRPWWGSGWEWARWDWSRSATQLKLESKLKFWLKFKSKSKLKSKFEIKFTFEKIDLQHNQQLSKDNAIESMKDQYWKHVENCKKKTPIWY